jgi:hypothetical protein
VRRQVHNLSVAARKFGLCSKRAPAGTLYSTFLCCVCCLFCEDCCRVDADIALESPDQKTRGFVI